MNFRITLTLLFICALFPCKGWSQMSQTETAEISVISANIRVALKQDDAKGFGWANRKELVFEVLKMYKPDILCLQEVLEIQNEDFKESFPDFHSFGFEGPEMDAHDDDEYHGIAKNPILFSKKKYEFISGGTIWLSETPHLGGSMDWGTARARHVNWVRLKDKKTGKVFRVLNTHLDHVSEEAKLMQAAMILEESQQYPKAFPQILAGDFNSDRTSRPIETIESYWNDTYTQIHGKLDPGFTVHGFIGPNAKTKKGKVDFIFSRGAVSVEKAAVIKDQKDGVYPSDHYFVFAKLQL